MSLSRSRALQARLPVEETCRRFSNQEATLATPNIGFFSSLNSSLKNINQSAKEVVEAITRAEDTVWQRHLREIPYSGHGQMSKEAAFECIKTAPVDLSRYPNNPSVNQRGSPPTPQCHASWCPSPALESDECSVLSSPSLSTPRTSPHLPHGPELNSQSEEVPSCTTENLSFDVPSSLKKHSTFDFVGPSRAPNSGSIQESALTPFEVPPFGPVSEVAKLRYRNSSPTCPVNRLKSIKDQDLTNYSPVKRSARRRTLIPRLFRTPSEVSIATVSDISVDPASLVQKPVQQKVLGAAVSKKYTGSSFNPSTTPSSSRRARLLSALSLSGVFVLDAEARMSTATSSESFGCRDRNVHAIPRVEVVDWDQMLTSSCSVPSSKM